MNGERQELLYRLGEKLIEKRRWVTLGVTVVTLIFAFFALRLELLTRFDELLPQTHPFIQLHNQYAPTFGGANAIMVMLEVKEGSIFNVKTMDKIFRMTQAMDRVYGVNHNQIESIAHRTNRHLRVGGGGLIVMEPVMARGPRSEEEVEVVKHIVHTSRNLYGVLVSLDDKAAITRARFLEGRLNHRRLFEEVTRTVVEPFEDDNTMIHVAGEPWLYGWVYHYATEVFLIFLATAVLLWILLYGYFRDVRGALRPTITGVISAIWGLGFIKMIGFSLDPLTLVVPFFVTARAVSHSVQMHDRYYEEYRKASWNKEKAIVAAFAQLFVPTLSGILTDALGLMVILLVPIVLLQKLAISAAVWILAITVSELLFNPIVYYYLNPPDREVVERRERGPFKRAIRTAGEVLLSPVGKTAAIASWVVVLCVCVYFWRSLVIGDPSAVTPLLQRDSPYNRAHARIQEVFGGVEPLMVVVERQGKSTIQEPVVLRAIEKFQRYLERDPSVGASFSFVDIITSVNSVMHELEPKWEVIPTSTRTVGMLFGIFFSGASYQETERFARADFTAAPITFFCTDHRGDNIRRVIKRSREFIEAHPLKEATFRLAGGLIGVLAAANEELLKNDILINVLGFATIFGVVAATYRSLAAGVYMLIPLLMANAVANAYMGARDIGININTLPVVTVGVGFGIDYGLYIVSRVIEEFRRGAGLEEAVQQAVATSGKAVTFTALTMILGTLFWTFSSIRFDAEMGLLLALWMGVSFLATMTLLPVLIVVFRPRFILDKQK